MFGIENASLSPVNYDNDFDSVEDYVKYIKDHLKTTHDKAFSNQERLRKLKLKYINKFTKPRTFVLGQLVMKRIMKVSANRNLVASLKGPYVILKINKSDSTAFLLNIKTLKVSKQHFNLLYQYLDDDNARIASNWNEDIKKTINNLLKNNALKKSDSKNDLDAIQKSNNPYFERQNSV